MATIPELGNVPTIAGDKGWTEPESAANTSYQPDRKSTRLNSSHVKRSRMPSSA